MAGSSWATLGHKLVGFSLPQTECPFGTLSAPAIQNQAASQTYLSMSQACNLKVRMRSDYASRVSGSILNARATFLPQFVQSSVCAE